MDIASYARRRRGARIICFVITSLAIVLTGSARVTAQEPTHQHPPPATEQGVHAGHDTAQMTRDGSGTAWLPDESPMYAIHSVKGLWTFMFHENAFVQYLHESGERGDDQFGSINWVMGMAQRNVGRGRLGIRGMFSAEPWSIPGCGYPDLLATGEESATVTRSMTGSIPTTCSWN